MKKRRLSKPRGIVIKEKKLYYNISDIPKPICNQNNERKEIILTNNSDHEIIISTYKNGSNCDFYVVDFQSQRKLKGDAAKRAYWSRVRDGAAELIVEEI